MASTDIVNSVASSEDSEVPQWKKELMYDRKTYARTLTSSGGNIKLTVTCPKSLRPKLKKQISSVQESLKSNRNGKINEKEETINLVNKLNTLKLTEDNMVQQNNVNNITTTDEIDRYLSTENFPKPGTVQTLKSRYLSLIETGNDGDRGSGIEKRSSSFESMLDSKNPFLEEIRHKSLSISGPENLLQPTTADNDEYPKPCIVSTTKKLFEIPEQQIKYNTNPFIKPPLMPKPPTKPRRIIKPSLPPNKPALSSRYNIYSKTPTVNPFCNGVTSPTSPIKSGRNLY